VRLDTEIALTRDGVSHVQVILVQY
jgi:hypothetical protein